MAGLLLAAEGQGQDKFRREFAVGGSFGMGVSSVSFVPKVPEKLLLGSHWGATVRWITEKHLGLIAEVNYSQQGWTEKFDEAELNYTRRINFLEIPFLTHLYYGERVRFFFNLGPKIGFYLSESMSGNAAGNPDFSQYTSGVFHPSEQWNMAVENVFAWGLCGGPGLEIRTKAGSFQMEARYYYALGDIYGSRKADYFPKSSGQVILAKLTYLIPLKK
ncbi:MAG: PorT family protein [Bacteroidales bacterium]